MHTNGEWGIGLQSDEERTQVITQDGQHLCYVEQDPHLEFANLIAAAPRMYEALKGMMEIAEMAMPDTYFQTDSRVNATRQALSLAEGGME